MKLSENYYSRLQSLAGILQENKKELIVKKIGVPDFVAEWSESLSEKYAVWIADSFKKHLITKTEFSRMIDVPKHEIDNQLVIQRSLSIDEYIKDTMESLTDTYNYILDWLRGRSGGTIIETDKFNLEIIQILNLDQCFIYFVDIIYWLY